VTCVKFSRIIELLVNYREKTTVFVIATMIPVKVHRLDAVVKCTTNVLKQ